MSTKSIGPPLISNKSCMDHSWLPDGDLKFDLEGHVTFKIIWGPRPRIVRIKRFYVLVQLDPWPLAVTWRSNVLLELSDWYVVRIARSQGYYLHKRWWGHQRYLTLSLIFKVIWRLLLFFHMETTNFDPVLWKIRKFYVKIRVDLMG